MIWSFLRLSLSLIMFFSYIFLIFTLWRLTKAHEKIAENLEKIITQLLNTIKK